MIDVSSLIERLRRFNPDLANVLQYLYLLITSIKTPEYNDYISIDAASGDLIIHRVTTNVISRLDSVRVARSGSVMISNGQDLDNGASEGFLYIPVVSGAPTGTPRAFRNAMPLVFDRTNDKLYAYTSGAWKSVTLT